MWGRKRQVRPKRQVRRTRWQETVIAKANFLEHEAELLCQQDQFRPPDRSQKAIRDAVLTATLRAYADCDMNVARTAVQLVVHPNTVHYRLRRIEEATGRDPRRFGDLVDLLVGLGVGEASRDS